MRPFKLFIVFILLPLVFFEVVVRLFLFSYSSYTKSQSFDSTLKDLKASHKNDIYFFGDSEVRWGVEPLYFDETLRRNGADIQSFNFGIDGFSSGLNLSMSQKVDFSYFKGIKIALIGVQLIEYNHVFDSAERIRGAAGSGALQRPIFLSAFGLDNNLQEWATNAPSFLDRSPLAFIRYRSSIKDYFSFPKPVYRPPTERGFQPHISISANPDNFQGEIKGKSEDKSNTPKNYEPLDATIWASTLQKDQYFDQYSRFFLERNVLPVFFALPTNPWLIDFKNRRDSYKVNSIALAQWASESNLFFLDVGVLDSFSPTLDYADFRHLSFRGAAKFSDLLASELAKTPKIIQYLKKSDDEKRIAIKKILNKCGSNEVLSPAKMKKEFIVDYDISETSEKENFLYIRATGNDSRLILPSLKSFIGSDIVLDFSIETASDTTFTTSWTTEKNPSFNGPMTVEHTLRSGINNFSIEVNADSQLKSIRVDPGQIAGDYKIYSMSYSGKCK